MAQDINVKETSEETKNDMIFQLLYEFSDTSEILVFDVNRVDDKIIFTPIK